MVLFITWIYRFYAFRLSIVAREYANFENKLVLEKLVGNMTGNGHI